MLESTGSEGIIYPCGLDAIRDSRIAFRMAFGTLPEHFDEVLRKARALFVD